ncbi:uncharacterized protein VP01_1569g4 [Puccinia sorghi]|uniref:Uncharacterized protein n=1 Tax=Puccinia sorghi TaxID=27349 RepID=A0A0L6VHX4_9BASI|nr:uncharacterized protein VP01_1569g4 [Puccinia sorghi]
MVLSNHLLIDLWRKWESRKTPTKDPELDLLQLPSQGGADGLGTGTLEDSDQNAVLVTDDVEKLSPGNLVRFTDIVSTLIQQQRQGMRTVISTQEPSVVPAVILDLLSLHVLHWLGSPIWAKHLSKRICVDDQDGSPRSLPLRPYCLTANSSLQPPKSRPLTTSFLLFRCRKLPLTSRRIMRAYLETWDEVESEEIKIHAKLKTARAVNEMNSPIHFLKNSASTPDGMRSIPETGMKVLNFQLSPLSSLLSSYFLRHLTWSHCIYLIGLTMWMFLFWSLKIMCFILHHPAHHFSSLILMIHSFSQPQLNQLVSSLLKHSLVQAIHLIGSLIHLPSHPLSLSPLQSSTTSLFLGPCSPFLDHQNRNFNRRMRTNTTGTEMLAGRKFIRFNKCLTFDGGTSIINIKSY